MVKWSYLLDVEWQNVSFNKIVGGVISVNPYFGYHIRAKINSIGVDKNDGKVYVEFKFSCGCACSIQHKNCIEPIPIEYAAVIVICDRCRKPIFRVLYFTNGYPDSSSWNLQIPKR